MTKQVLLFDLLMIDLYVIGICWHAGYDQLGEAIWATALAICLAVLVVIGFLGCCARSRPIERPRTITVRIIPNRS